jgi:3-methyladenine DNA glycosylase AlkC
MRNHTVLDKSNSSLGRMAVKDRIEYARVKLDELKDIKELYVKNGGNKTEFKNNVDKMIEFYSKFLKDNEERQKDDGPYLNSSQNLIESRCSTPILKLRELNEDELPNNRRRNKQSAVKEKPLDKSKANNANQITNATPNMAYGGYPFNQPPVIMMPYAPPSQPPADSMRFLERMMELKA